MLTRDRFAQLYQLAQLMPPEAFVKFASETTGEDLSGVLLSQATTRPKRDRSNPGPADFPRVSPEEQGMREMNRRNVLQTELDAALQVGDNAEVARITKEMQKTSGQMNWAVEPSQEAQQAPPPPPAMPEFPISERISANGFPTVDPSLPDLGLGGPAESAGSKYLAALMASGLPVGGETSMMAGNGILPGDQPFPYPAGGLSPDAMKAMAQFMPRAPEWKMAPFIGGGPGPSQVQMDPIVPERALRAQQNIPTLAQLLGFIGR